MITESVLTLKPSKVSIFPGARESFRIIPKSIIDNVSLINDEYNLTTKVIKVSTQSQDFVTSDSGIIFVNGFDRLKDQILDADIVVSADSLTAHLAEFYKKPVFVFTPTKKDYAMPLSVLKKNLLSLFADKDNKYSEFLKNIIGKKN
jgi:ADP-heptose:LPS heptosyltransferase